MIGRELCSPYSSTLTGGVRYIYKLDSTEKSLPIAPFNTPSSVNLWILLTDSFKPLSKPYSLPSLHSSHPLTNSLLLPQSLTQQIPSVFPSHGSVTSVLFRCLVYLSSKRMTPPSTVPKTLQTSTLQLTCQPCIPMFQLHYPQTICKQSPPPLIAFGVPVPFVDM